MTASTPTRRSRRGHGRATMDDVAAMAEVTKITVSRYLREPAKVADATAERIRAALASTGYVPNKQAGLLASGRSNIVAALIPNLSHSIFGETVQALSEGLQAAGFELLLASTGYALDREEEQLRALLGWAPSALVVTGRHHSGGAQQLLLDAHGAGTPVVEVWDHHPQAASPFAQVGFDHGAVGRAMAAHLIDTGHRALAYLDSGVDADFRAHERGAGFAAEARRRRVRCQTLRAETGDPFDAGRRAFHALCPSTKSPPERPSAVACANDHLACGVMMEALATGLAVPADLVVMGFGDFPVGRQLQPALSTVHPPSREIGRVTAQLLTQALASGERPRGTALPWQLLARASTQRVC
ncbi:MAG: LacI family DNA-binding transcriptional regulator [Ideonella sp.]|nr:LacI family DNA-binding transcriptional regulator [Ideonella sp.]